MEQIVNKRVALKLVGLDGNAFSIMAAFQRQARAEKWTFEEIRKVLDEAQSSDYNHLLVTIANHCEEPNDDDDDDCDDDFENDWDEEDEE